MRGAGQTPVLLLMAAEPRTGPLTPDVAGGWLNPSLPGRDMSQAISSILCYLSGLLQLLSRKRTGRCAELEVLRSTHQW